jgi:hypothetical protein
MPKGGGGGAVDELGRVLGGVGRVAWGPAPAAGEACLVGAAGKKIQPRMNTDGRGYGAWSWRLTGLLALSVQPAFMFIRVYACSSVVESLAC